MFRNLSLIGLAFVGMMIFFSEFSSQRLASAGNIDKVSKELDHNLTSILFLLKGYVAINNDYSNAISKGQRHISDSADPEQIKSAVAFLILENKKMLRETENYERRLEESRTQISRLRSILVEKELLSERDGLTSVYNRRYFDEKVVNCLNEAARSGASVSLILADIDNFKKINDAHGHLVGDEAIRIFAEVCQKSVRGQDIVARYGGEEFAIILPDAQLETAAGVAEQIRRWFNENTWRVRGKPDLEKITASFGVTQSRPQDSAMQLIERADASLYAAKESGKNKVISKL